MQSDRQLKQAFGKFNRLFWDGTLPEHTVIYWEPLSADAGQTCPVYEVDAGQFVIKIDPMYKGSPKWWKVILLHEMRHLALWTKHPKHQHGKLFRDEEARIFALGAFKDLL